MAVRVLAKDNSEWVVGRHWAPRIGNETAWGRFTRRFRSARRRAVDASGADPGGLVETLFEGLAVGVAVLLVGLFLFFVGLPFLLALLDIVLVLLLAVLGVLGRVFLRRPWTVEARPVRSKGQGSGREWRVAGWRDSGRFINDVAVRLSAGDELPPA